MIPMASVPISLNELIHRFCQKRSALSALYRTIEPQGSDVRFVAFLETNDLILDSAFKTSVIEEMKLDTPVIFDRRVALPKYCIYERENDDKRN